jgi:hypothetical protein
VIDQAVTTLGRRALAVLALLTVALLALPALARAQTESEFNDTPGTADGPIAGGATISGTRQTNDDADWFFFGVNGPATITIRVSNTTTAQNCTLANRAPDLCFIGAEVYRDFLPSLGNESGRRYGSARVIQMGQTWTQQIALPGAGTYLLHVLDGQQDHLADTYTFRIDGPIVTEGVRRPTEPPLRPDSEQATCDRLDRAYTRDLRTQRSHQRSLTRAKRTLRAVRFQRARRARVERQIRRLRRLISGDRRRIRTRIRQLRAAKCDCTTLPLDIRNLQNRYLRHLFAARRARLRARRARTINERIVLERRYFDAVRLVRVDRSRIRSHRARLRSLRCDVR